MKILINNTRGNLANALWQTLGLGVLAGMRTMSAPMIASHILSHHQTRNLKYSPLKFMQSNGFAIGMKVLAVGELVGDKLPNTPNRTDTGGVIGRCLAGSLAGAATFKASGNSAWAGALIGAATAFGSTYGCFYLRKFIVDKTNAFDPYIGAAEDALVVASAAGLIMSA